jgi:hypothetical protein
VWRTRKCRWCKAASRRRCCGGLVVVVEPLRAQTREAALSPKVAKVRRSTWTFCANTSWWARIPASSRSLLLIVPLRFVEETSLSETEASKRRRHTSGRQPGMNQTPPMPLPLASTAPMPEGSSVMISSIRVGRLWRSWANAAKSDSCWRIGRVSRMRWVASRCCKAVCSAENNPREPGIARAMLRSSPSTRCHVSVDTRRCPASCVKMSRRRSARCGGRVTVRCSVSTIHPSKVFCVAHAPSPLRSFLTDAGSFWAGRNGSAGCNTSSMECSSVRVICRRRSSEPCARPKKSSTNTSIDPTGVVRIRRDGRNGTGGRRG